MSRDPRARDDRRVGTPIARRTTWRSVCARPVTHHMASSRGDRHRCRARHSEPRRQVPARRRPDQLADQGVPRGRNTAAEDVGRADRHPRRRPRQCRDARRRRARRDRPRRELGSRPARRDRSPPRRRGPTQTCPRPARAHGEPAPHADRRTHLRVLQRGSRALRRTGGRVRPRGPIPRCRRDGQALRVQRHRDRPDDGQRRGRRTTAARALPATVRAGGQGGRCLGDHELVQPGRRGVRRGEPTSAHRHPAHRVGVRRLRRVRLVRRPRAGRCGQRRTHARDAGTGPRLRPPARRSRRTRRRHRGDRRRTRPRPAHGHEPHQGRRTQL